MSVKMGKSAAGALVPRDGKTVVRLRPENRKYRALLSIDGGGVRGVIPAVVMGGFEKAVKTVARELFAELEDVTDEDLVVDMNDYFDMISGNSAGSILAGFIASGGGAEKLYENGGPLFGMQPGSSEAALAMTRDLVKTTFKKSWIQHIPLISKLSGLFFAKYDGKGLGNALKTAFGDINLSDLKNNTYVTAYELSQARAVGFVKQVAFNTPAHGYVFGSERVPEPEKPMAEFLIPFNVPGIFQARIVDFPLWTACQASSSAPVYFDPLTYTREGLAEALGLKEDSVSWADGGLVNNNPTVIALSMMSAIFSPSSGGMLPLNNMAVMSLGTGTKRQAVDIRGGKGLASWGAELISVLMSANAQESVNLVEGVLEHKMFGTGNPIASIDTYIRIDKVARPGDTDFDVLGALDDVSNLPGLEEIGKKLATSEDNMSKMKAFVKNILMKENSKVAERDVLDTKNELKFDWIS